MILSVGPWLRVGALTVVGAAGLAGCTSASSTAGTTPTTRPSITAPKPPPAPVTTTTLPGASAVGLTAAQAAKWACDYQSALASLTSDGGSNVETQAIFDATQVAKFASIAYSDGGTPYEALDNDAHDLSGYAVSPAVNWSQPASFESGGPANEVSTDCQTPTATPVISQATSHGHSSSSSSGASASASKKQRRLRILP